MNAISIIFFLITIGMIFSSAPLTDTILMVIATGACVLSYQEGKEIKS